MTKHFFKLAEILQLHQELVGNQQIQGILGLPMTMLAKFRLGKLVGELTKLKIQLDARQIISI